MILFDTDVLAIYPFFTHDSRYITLKNCVDSMSVNMVATTIYNLFELARIPGLWREG